MEATFDTLSYFKKLKNAGVPEEQANIQAEALRQIVDGSLATKRDLKELEYKLTIRLGGITVAAISISTAILSMLK